MFVSFLSVLSLSTPPRRIDRSEHEISGVFTSTRPPVLAVVVDFCLSSDHIKKENLTVSPFH